MPNHIPLTLRIRYSLGVHVPAGWRQAQIVALADQISPGTARVREVETIDGESPHPGQSRTGAQRQEFNGSWWADKEIGKRKRLFACEIL